MVRTVGVVLSGCGYLDGAEVHESVCTLLSLDRAGVETRIYAPDVELDVVDHISGEATGERRSVLLESARIARGEIQEIGEANAEELDALILPGGFGAAKNLSSFASEGPKARIHEGLATLMREMHAAGKPIGAICISPALVALALGETHPELTIGNDAGTASALEALGCRHSDCPVEDFVIDRERKIVTTPAYMLGPSIAHVQQGIDKCVSATLDLI